MNAIRYAVTALSLILLTLGYASSQWAFFWDDPRVHALRMQQPAVRFLSLGVLILAIVLAFLPDRESERGEP